MEVRIHVACHGFNAVHPFKANIINEAADGLLLFAVCNPENVAGLQVNDDGGVSMTFMEQKLVNAKESDLLLRLNEFPIKYAVAFQPL